jgi:DNA polymerase (family 10)
MLNEEIAGIFEKMSRVLAFKNAERFRILAYQRAAMSLADLKEDLATVAREGRLEEIPGIGKALARMIREYIRTKRIRQYDYERKRIPDELIDLMDVPGLGPKTLAAIHKRFRIQNIEQLRRALDTGLLLNMPGFREKKANNLRRGIELWLARRQRMPLGTALPLAERLLESVRDVAHVEAAELAGSLRRRRETIGDIDLLVQAKDTAAALRAVTRLPETRHVVAVGDTKATVVLENGIQVDIRAVPEESFGAALQYFTGSKQHNVHLRTIARQLGLKINEYGVFRGTERLGGRSEEEIYRLLGIPIMPPEIREDRGEIEAATEGRLPALVELESIRGDLHVHSNYSDGRSTMQEMAEAADLLHYEYLAIADHSPSARVARGLDLERLEKKIEEFEELRGARQGKPLRLLLGVEADILPNGQLDYPDSILSKFDVITASVHAAFKQSKDRMTGRLLDALANPRVHILGHPTTRLIGARDPVNFDFARVVRTAVDRGVALEINGSPIRMDLTDTLARTAQEAGTLFAINSDAHSTSQLEYMRYGVAQARRGWIEGKNVINTWPTSKLLSWLKSRAKS